MTEAITIADDYGGDIAAYERRYEQISAFGGPIRIDGVCASACTLVLHLDHICVTPRAVFMFHAGNSDFARALMWDSYSLRLRARLTDEGALTGFLIVMRWPETEQFAPPCG